MGILPCYTFIPPPELQAKYDTYMASRPTDPRMDQYAASKKARTDPK